MVQNLFCVCGHHPRPSTPSTTRQDFSHTTDIFLPAIMESSDLQVNEVCLTEDTKFVACTAKFSETWNIIPLRLDLCPKEYVPELSRVGWKSRLTELQY